MDNKSVAGQGGKKLPGRPGSVIQSQKLQLEQGNFVCSDRERIEQGEDKIINLLRPVWEENQGGKQEKKKKKSKRDKKYQIQPGIRKKRGREEKKSKTWKKVIVKQGK